jgi:alginate O-acetyltransferase complex protein AlgI
MLFNSFIFLIFLGLVLPVYYLLKKKSSRNIFLIISSYFFYGYWDWRFCFLLLTVTLIDFFIGLKIYKTNQKSTGKIFYLTGIIFNLLVLGLFKYYNFFIDNLQEIFKSFSYNLDFLHLNILLPIGISYYIFHSISYLVDIKKGTVNPSTNLIDFALYISFFPKLIAGPIERASNLLPQIERKTSATKEQLMDGTILIIYGLFKKVMIGDAAGRLVDHIFAHMEYYSSWEVVFAWLLFSIQIYADFSGYTNIARGTAKLFGFELMKNFEQPYLSRSIAEFWKKWHISMTTWFRDYVFLPISFNVSGKIKTERAFFLKADIFVYFIASVITWFLTGLWHGANYTFIVWGMIHGFCLFIYQWQRNPRKKLFRKLGLSNDNPGIVITETILTMVIVNIAWLVFRIKNIGDLSTIFLKCYNWTWGNYPGRFLTILLGFTLVVILFDIIEKRTNSHVFFRRIRSKPLMFGILTIMMISVILFLINSKPLPFIYFQF